MGAGVSEAGYVILLCMTESDIVAHWRKGAKDALRVATLSYEDGKYELALFHCHLAVEKALKAAIMEKTKKPHPKIHELFKLAMILHEEWSTEDRQLLDVLSDFAVSARYDDPAWAEHFATAENTMLWISKSQSFLATLLP